MTLLAILSHSKVLWAEEELSGSIHAPEMPGSPISLSPASRISSHRHSKGTLGNAELLLFMFLLTGEIIKEHLGYHTVWGKQTLPEAPTLSHDILVLSCCQINRRQKTILPEAGGSCCSSWGAPLRLFFGMSHAFKTSLAYGALLFFLSLPFLGDHSSPHLENQPLVSKAGIIWPWQRTCLVLWLSWRCLLTLMSMSGDVSWRPQNCEPMDQHPGEPGLPGCFRAASLEMGISWKMGKTLSQP